MNPTQKIDLEAAIKRIMLHGPDRVVINSAGEAVPSNYGGRGIRVCDRWKDYTLFVADMGQPKNGDLIDRINNDGNYEPENCRWTDAKTQANNRRPWSRHYAA